MKRYLQTLFQGEKLARPEAQQAMRSMLGGEGTPEQVAAFLALLHVRGESVEELAGFLEVIRSEAVKVPVKSPLVFDTCGTGGDGAGTFNISTATALVVAGAGLKVAKHGNRSVSSRCGSADVLEALGVKIDHGAFAAAQAIDEDGFGFLFAPLYHPALAKVGPIRRALGMRTAFNLLGPLANPAGAQRQVIGVYSRNLLAPFAQLLREMGTVSAAVVASEDGTDEFSLGGKNYVALLKNGSIQYLELTPEDFGLKPSDRASLQGGDASTNAGLIEKILTGETKGPGRDVVAMNAAAALVVAGLAPDFRAGVKLAEASLDEGRAEQVLARARKRKGP